MSAAARDDVNQAQIDALGERMSRGFEEIKTMLLRYEERLRGIETREAGCSPLITARIDAAWRRLDTHDVEISKLNEMIKEVSQTAKQLESISKWLLGIITAVIISFAIALATGRVDIVMR